MRCIVELNGESVNGVYLGVFQHSRVIDPSPMIGGHTGGVVAYPVAVVRLDDGLREFRLSDVTFENENNHDVLIKGVNDIRIRQGLEPLPKEDPLLRSINGIRMHMGWKPLVSVEKSRQSLEEFRKTMEKHGEYFK